MAIKNLLVPLTELQMLCGDGTESQNQAFTDVDLMEASPQRKICLKDSNREEQDPLVQD